MKIVKYYICPVCGLSYTTEQKAIDCRNGHEIKTQEWAYCEACRGGWNIDQLGESAILKAKECERKHKEKGEFEKVQAATRFFYNSF